ncbi:hypothetical protein N0V90_010752 [Kalmusia sp. IMI 367209]|nr:hypothetical protein N0V90_010752 [Kalmusia sp. IMI 367209]
MPRAVSGRKNRLEAAEQLNQSRDGYDNIDMTTPAAQSIFKWLSMIPPHPSLLLHPEASPSLDATIYHDWFNWADFAVQTLLDELDIYEMEYRRLGLKYHGIPHNERHSSSLLTSASFHRALRANAETTRANPSVLRSLETIFETDCPRTQQSFFLNWRTAYQEIAEMKNLCASAPHTDRVLTLAHRMKIMEKRFMAVNRLADRIKAQLKSVKRSVDAVRAKSKASSDLAAPFSKEGSLYRRWVNTFEEVVSRTWDLESVEQMLRVGGAELSIEWRNGVGRKKEKAKRELEVLEE